MILEKIEAVSKILFAGVASLVLGVMGWQIQWKQLGIQSDDFCLNHSATIVQLTSQAVPAGGFQNPAIRETLVKLYASRCDIDGAAALEAINNEISVNSIVESEVVRETEQIASTGFVAFGKVQPDNPEQNRNFKLASARAEDGKYVPDAGDVLVAKWGVNLRENTKITTGGENPAIGIVFKGECVSVTSPVEELRGQYWLQVEELDVCPDGTVI